MYNVALSFQYLKNTVYICFINEILFQNSPITPHPFSLSMASACLWTNKILIGHIHKNSNETNFFSLILELILLSAEFLRIVF